ncbi:MAG: hypothetical protein ACYCXR_08155 [Coriobacteriia bacterium]
MGDYIDFTQGVDESERLIEHGVARRPVVLGMGALIGIGAGLGMTLGVILGQMVLGMIAGAAVGTVAGAVVESLRSGQTD